MRSSIYLIRHGITEGNQKKWFYGAADLPLTEEGQTELRALAEKGVYPCITEDTDCYTTGPLRTEQTFEILFGKREHRVIPALREMEFGRYECHSYEELKDDPEFSVWCWDQTGDAKLSGGETRNEFAARIERGMRELLGYHRLKELSHRHSGMEALSVVVCHGGVISQVMQRLFPGEKKTIWDWMPDPGQGYRIDFEKSDPSGFEVLK